MKSCSKHKSTVGDLSNPELAKEIGDLRYDALIELFNAISKKFEIDSEADRNRGRTQLANHLLNISIKFKDIEVEMAEIWKICEPYMKKDNNE